MTNAQFDTLQKRIPELHRFFCELAGIDMRDMPLTMEDRYYWERWSTKFEEDNMRTVHAHTQRFNRTRSREFQRQFTFPNIVENCRKFESWLREAQTEERRIEAEKRQPKINHDRKQVLQSTGRRAEPAKPEPRTAGQVMERSKLATMLKEWRERNLNE